MGGRGSRSELALPPRRWPDRLRADVHQELPVWTAGREPKRVAPKVSGARAFPLPEDALREEMAVSVRFSRGAGWQFRRSESVTPLLTDWEACAVTIV